MNAQKDDITVITNRILKNFYKMYDRRLINVNFDIADLSSLDE